MSEKSVATLSRFLAEHSVDYVQFVGSDMLLRAYGGKSFADLVEMGLSPPEAFALAGHFFQWVGKQGDPDAKILDTMPLAALHECFNTMLAAVLPKRAVTAR